MWGGLRVSIFCGIFAVNEEEWLKIFMGVANLNVLCEYFIESVCSFF